MVPVLAICTALAVTASNPTCHDFPNKIVGASELPFNPGNKTSAGACCAACGERSNCVAWTWHSNGRCIFKDNAKSCPGNPKSVVSGLHPGPTCIPRQQPSMCPAAAACPDCGGDLCPCDAQPHAPPPPPPPPTPLTPACTAPHDKYKFCDTTLSTAERVADLLQKIPDETKPNLLTARGGHGLQNYTEIGVPAYYWGTNCLHSVGAGCINGRCPTNFPSGPSMAATFDRAVMVNVSTVWGRELRALYNAGVAKGIDCWGPVVNLNRDPRWGRNGEGGAECV